MSFNKFVNTEYFREPALFFEKNKCYTDAFPGTRDYDDFWDREEKRCLEGYQVGDLWIPGRYYFYLNYVPIIRTLSKEEKEKYPHLTELYSFPRFWELDYEWFTAKDNAWKAGKHMVCLKTRRGGFSYKEAADGIYNYNFIPMSKSFYFAATEGYLLEDGIFNKVYNNLEWLNTHTDWYKNRHVTDTKWHRKASYIAYEDGKKIESGYRSELMAQVLDNADKARGKSGIKITFEEGGSFKELKRAWQICEPQVKQGGIMKGQMTAFGTGGNEKDDGLASLSDLFNDPHTYNVYAFNNIWDEGLEGTECGFFVPAYMIREDCMDKDGNLDKEKATEAVIKEREPISKSTDRAALIRHVAENPLTPAEALSRVSGNYFPTVELRAQLRRVEAENLQNTWINGQLFNIDGDIKFGVTNDKPLVAYPIRPDSKEDRTYSLEGCISILQSPIKIKGSVPKNLYFISIDPYAQDESPNSNSVGAVYVMKRENNLTLRDNYNNNIVASYIGRPKNLQIFWRNVFKLAEFYNCRVQSELVGGGSIGVQYARNWRKLHLLEQQIDINSNKSGKPSGAYFMKVNKDMKLDGIEYLSDWLSEEVAIGLDMYNKPVYKLRLENITDVGLLNELIKFNLDGNFDRVSSMIVAMYMIKELERTKVKSTSRFNNNLLGSENWFTNE